jgi:hypothetical protein
VNAAKENKSIKGCYSGLTWDKNILKQKIQMAAQQLTVLQKASKSIQTGKYRVYLAPAAVAEIMDLIRWGFGYEYYKDGNSPFKDLYEKNKSFSPLFHLQENFASGFGPRFNSLGEISSEQIPLIQNGQMKNLLVSSRSALEYKLESNQADVYECMRAPEISPGTLSATDIFSELGTGIYINNLHYLNYSDVPSAKITGMTRYACFWVQDGQIEAPIQDMRFDASLYDMVGAYAAFVNHGIWTEPIYLLRIEDKNGHVLYEQKPKIVQALDEQYAYTMVNMLKDVVQEGTAARLRFKYNLNYPMGGKTGTTQNNSDGWFVGITPQLVTGVWMGCEDRAIHFSATVQGQGANSALPVFALFMKRVYADPTLKYSKGDFDPPKNGVDITTDCSNYHQTASP